MASKYLTEEEILEMVSVTDNMAEDSEAGGDDDADDYLPTVSTPSTSTGVSLRCDFDDDDMMEDNVAPDVQNFRNDMEEEDIISSSDECSENCIEWNKTGQIPQMFANTDFSQPCGISGRAQVNINSPMEILLLFLNLDFLQNIVLQSNLYANQRGNILNLSVDELQAFIGILIIMGLNPLPSMRLYWSVDKNFYNERVACIMPIKRFLKILRFLHLNDNNSRPNKGEPNYRIHKVKPLLDVMNVKCRELFNPSRYLSIDESMIKFKGRSSLKQYMPMKPIKRGFKMWVIACGVTGYCLGMNLYEGKEESCVNSRCSLGERVVIKLAEAFEGFGYCLFFDNFFSSIQMVKNLLEKKFFACGTLRQTRKLFPANKLVPDKSLKMGESDSVMAGDVTVCKWKDRGKKCVCVVSTMHNPLEEGHVLRKNKKGEKETVTCPVAIRDYNRYMGGVDYFDQLHSAYSIGWKSRRWWMRIFYYVVDACIVNSYILYKSTLKEVLTNRNALTQLKFRSVLANELIGSFCSRIKKGPVAQTGKGRKRNHPDGRPTIENFVRLTNVGDHLPVKGSTYRRCANCSTKKQQKRTNTLCSKCDVGLCIECFVQFHKS